MLFEVGVGMSQSQLTGIYSGLKMYFISKA
jgi:hypothetical protein